MMFVRPKTLDDALEIISSSKSIVFGGGTILYSRIDNATQSTCVDLTSISELHGISFVENHLRIRSMTTWSDIFTQQLPLGFAAVQDASRTIGSLQIQNRATIGGNVRDAHPKADGFPPLLVLNASIEIASNRGVRLIPVHKFLRQPNLRVDADELITAILAPYPPSGSTSAFMKLLPNRLRRVSPVSSAVLLCGSVNTIDDVRIAVGSCYSTPHRLHALEGELLLQPSLHDAMHYLSASDLVPYLPHNEQEPACSLHLKAGQEAIRRTFKAALTRLIGP